MVDGPRVYAQSCRGEFRCFNTADGKPLWKVNFVKDYDAEFLGEVGPGSARLPRIHRAAAGGRRADHRWSRRPAPRERRRFRQGRWQRHLEIAGRRAGLCRPGHRATGRRRQIVSFTSPGVIGLDAADGKLLCDTAVKTSCSRHITTPIVADDMVVVSSHEAGLLGFRITESAGGKGDSPMTAKRAWVRKTWQSMLPVRCLSVIRFTA